MLIGTGQPRRFRPYTARDIDSIPELESLSARDRLEMRAVSTVLPFRTNAYVVEELIDWSRIPDDPIFQLSFPQPGMLDPADLLRMTHLIRSGAPGPEVRAAARRIQIEMNPHPASQMDLNVPRLSGVPMPGMQHKYRETVLFFPSQGQACYAYCTYCFRWPQFLGIEELRFSNGEVSMLVRYLERHPEVSDVLMTGGDPLIMGTRTLRSYVEPLLGPRTEHVTNIRIGTKAPANWPFRFLTDPDADDLLRLFEEVVASGRQLALMAHYSHPRELETRPAQAALRRIGSTGAVVRTQCPLVRHVNDRGDVWADMWRIQTRLGAVPYYMFMARDTGPKRYFDVPLARAVDIYNRAFRSVSGLARTVRGPSMSTTPGKVVVNGVARIHGETVFALEFLQAREPRWVGRPFFARFDRDATWLCDLEPAFADEFFFSRALEEMEAGEWSPTWAIPPGLARRRPTPSSEPLKPYTPR